MAMRRAVAAHWVGFAIMVGVGAAGTTDAGAATALRWKFAAGEVLHYESAQTTTSKIKDPTGQEVTQTFTLTTNLTWKVREVDTQGLATLTQTIERIRTTATLPFGKFSFDSKEGGDASGPAGPLFKMLIGAEFQFKMNSRGEMSDIQLAEKLLSTLRGDKEPAGAQGQFSEAGLKNMLVQMGLVFPEDATEAGQTWSRKIAIPAGANGETREIEQVYTLRDAGAAEPPVAAVEMETRFQPVPADPNVPVTIKTQAATGQYQFDNQAGRIRTSRVVEKVDLTGQIQGKEIGQANETVTVLTLLPEKTP